MKLTAILLFAACMQISAKGVSQSVTLSLKDAPLEKAFKEIQKQTGYNFIYYKDVLAGTKNVNLIVKNAQLENVLQSIFNGQPVTYTISGKYIAIKEKKKNIAAPELINEPPPPIDVHGRVVNEKGEPVEGATVQVKGDKIKGTSTNADGYFTLTDVDEDATLVISGVNVEMREVKVGGKGELGSLVMKMKVGLGEEVVVNTGYQQLPKERATGSFTSVNNTLFNRSVSTDVLSRLENVTNGLLFDRRNTGKPALRIRGQSTIESDASPLIIVDNFPYYGDINNLNPNDIESVTILKDAAAASIWGTRAGNGVIVITTKLGSAEQPLKISFNTNLTVGDKPDLYYNRNFLNSKDFIEVEQDLFSRGYYKRQETDKGKTLSPAVKLFIAERDGKITTEEMNYKLNELKKLDVRDQFSKHLYQQSLNQQYSLSLKGGSKQIRYYFSGGLDQNRESLVRNNLSRFTINSSTTYLPVKSLEITTRIAYVNTTQKQNNTGEGQVNGGGGKLLYPYAKIARQDGTPLPVGRDYNSDYIIKATETGLLDWQYRPLEDLHNANNKLMIEDIRLQTSAKFHIYNWMNLEGNYLYEQQRVTTRNLMSEKLYYVRNLINQYGYDNGTEIEFRVPRGNILDQSTTGINSHSGRVQFNINRKWELEHELSALAGYEIRLINTNGHASRLYGYDDELALFESVDLSNRYPVNPYGYSDKIPSFASLTDLTDRNISYFANASYIYKQRYIASGSARKDASNLFGVNTNQKWVPLWSAGLAWIVSSESFFPFSQWLPYLKLRLTRGYNGNVNKSLTAYTTASYSTNFNTGLSQLRILTPPNPALRWEKINIVNVGVDFQTKNNLISGSIEYYYKNGIDLIGSSPLDPTTGFSVAGRTNFTGNNADIKGHGFDIQMNINKNFNKIKWNSSVIFNYAIDEVTKYNYEHVLLSFLGNYPTPVVGKPRFSLYSFKSAGLNPETGDPRIYVNKKITEDYGTVSYTATFDDLVYHGSALPKTFASWRNSVTVFRFSIGCNISYKAGFYFRRSSILYTGLFDNWSGNVDFGRRWQKPGDELITEVPSLPGASNSRRDFVYANSSSLVEKGDHVRFQDIHFSYRFQKSRDRWLPFASVSIYGYINNLGILWRANNFHIDPDYVFRPYTPSKTYSLGIAIEF